MRWAPGPSLHQVALQAVEVTPEQAQLQAGLCPGRYVCLGLPTRAAAWMRPPRAGIRTVFTTKPPGVGSGLGSERGSWHHAIHDGAIVLESEPGRKHI
jgi:hypothetical protein